MPRSNFGGFYSTQVSYDFDENLTWGARLKLAEDLLTRADRYLYTPHRGFQHLRKLLLLEARRHINEVLAEMRNWLFVL